MPPPAVPIPSTPAPTVASLALTHFTVVVMVVAQAPVLELEPVLLLSLLHSWVGAGVTMCSLPWARMSAVMEGKWWQSGGQVAGEGEALQLQPQAWVLAGVRVLPATCLPPCTQIQDEGPAPPPC